MEKILRGKIISAIIRITGRAVIASFMTLSLIGLGNNIASSCYSILSEVETLCNTYITTNYYNFVEWEVSFIFL